MNKAELVAAMAAKTGDTKKGTEEYVNALVDVITAALKKGEQVQLVGFGSFEVRKRAARKEETHKLEKKLRFLHQNHQYLNQVKLSKI